MVRRGPPAKWNDEIERKVLDALAAGNYIQPACAFAGIKDDTFYRQIKKSAVFAEKVKQAIAQAEVVTVAYWRKQMPDNWQAARDFLARRHPERWASREKVEHMGKDGAPLAVELTWPDAKPDD